MNLEIRTCVTQETQPPVVCIVLLHSEVAMYSNKLQSLQTFMLTFYVLFREMWDLSKSACHEKKHSLSPSPWHTLAVTMVGVLTGMWASILFHTSYRCHNYHNKPDIKYDTVHVNGSTTSLRLRMRRTFSLARNPSLFLALGTNKISHEVRLELTLLLSPLVSSPPRTLLLPI